MRQFFFIILLFISLISWSPPSPAAQGPSEYQVKAAYLYNFAKFITWPETTFSDEKAPFIIGILGKNEFNGYLEPLTSKTIRSRTIEIKYFKTLAEVKNCHLLYISKAEDEDLEPIFKKLAVSPIITVGDSKRFVALGGVIQFITKRDRLRFSINLDTAKNNKIKIEAQLLSLAVKVLEANK